MKIYYFKNVFAMTSEAVWLSLKKSNLIRTKEPKERKGILSNRVIYLKKKYRNYHKCGMAHIVQLTFNWKTKHHDSFLATQAYYIELNIDLDMIVFGTSHNSWLIKCYSWKKNADFR